MQEPTKDDLEEMEAIEDYVFELDETTTIINSRETVVDYYEGRTSYRGSSIKGVRLG